MADVVNKTTMELRCLVHTPDYEGDVDWLINPAGLDTLKGAVDPGYWKLTAGGDDIEEMTAAEKTAADDSAERLDPEKDRRLAQINHRTDELVDTGQFEYPASSGNFFSLEPGARENWSGLWASRTILSFPQTVGTLDYDDFDIDDVTELTNFYGTALLTVKGIREAGQDYRKQIRDATTRAAVDAVVDTRT
jgi:hypothetical protein